MYKSDFINVTNLRTDTHRYVPKHRKSIHEYICYTNYRINLPFEMYFKCNISAIIPEI